jgi:hypothetical protein
MERRNVAPVELSSLRLSDSINRSVEVGLFLVFFDLKRPLRVLLPLFNGAKILLHFSLKKLCVDISTLRKAAGGYELESSYKSVTRQVYV